MARATKSPSGKKRVKVYDEPSPARFAFSLPADQLKLDTAPDILVLAIVRGGIIVI